EMSQELLERGVSGTRLLVARPDSTEPIVYETDRLKALMAALDELEESLVILERRGLSILNLFGRMKDGKLPAYRVLLGSQEHWFFTSEEMDAFRRQHQQEGHELVVADEQTGGSNG